MQFESCIVFFYSYLRWSHSLVQPVHAEALRHVKSLHVLRMMTATTTTATTATITLCQSIPYINNSVMW